MNKVYVLIGLQEGKLSYLKIYKNRDIAEKTMQDFIKFDEQYNHTNWEYFIQTEYVNIF